MDDRQIKVIIGSLLHDIGKVAYRSGDGRNHSQAGYDFLKELDNGFDTEILNCVRYHHGIHLKNANIDNNSLAYLTYFADNVAAAMDRREGLESEDGFDKTVPLSSVFNLLNGNHDHQHYAHQVLDPNGPINYPTGKEVKLDETFYSLILDNIRDNLRGIVISEEYINSLLSVMEANLSYIPSSTSKREQADISLYDHVKLTAAISECLYQYFKQENITDYRECLFSAKAEQGWKEQLFLLYSMDISGIQKFIYTISSKGALKGLRARSFYLEILMEHIIDELLDALQLSRSCLIYSGGGHCYMLLPNTEETKEKIREQNARINAWFMEYFGIELYVAFGAAPCSANSLKNEPEGSYSALYLDISKQISLQKSHRYSAEQILAMNRRHLEGKKECKICRRVDKVDAEDRCSVCASLEKLSADILYQDYFIIMLDNLSSAALPLPNGKYLLAGDEKKLRYLMDQDTYVRSYTKNNLCTGKHVTTKLWVGDYTTGETFEQLANKSEGIERIAVLRGDVDNLGTAFVRGFRRENGDGRYETLSRTAALSRQLSLFFKFYLNKLLENGTSSVLSQHSARQVCIVYSGGDDIFLVGAWNEVLDAFLDIRNALEKFTEGTLTISGGTGLYSATYPINRMALETAELEDYSKKNPEKNSVTLLDQSGRYAWPVFIQDVIQSKYQCVSEYMNLTQQRGKAFLYHLMELLREAENPTEENRKYRFNRARFVYYLSRMEPDKRDDPAENEAFQKFSQKMYQWSMDPEDRRQLVTAIYLYVYLTREKEGVKDNDHQ